MEKIYHDRLVASSRTIESHTKKLRKKIADVNSDMGFIHSVFGVGHKYEAA